MADHDIGLVVKALSIAEDSCSFALLFLFMA